MSEIVRENPLNRNQERALTALLTSTSIAAAAKAANLSERTIRRYLQSPDFAQEYEKRTEQLIADASSALKRGAMSAITALAEICQDAESPPTARVSAARVLLDACIRFDERRMLEEAAQEHQTSVPTFFYDPHIRHETPISQETRNRVARFLSGDCDESDD